MRYHYIITTQHTGRTGSQIVATGSGTLDVSPEATERDVYTRIETHEVNRLGMDWACFSVLFYRAVPDERVRDRG